MVESGILRVLHNLANGVGRDIGDQLGAGGGAELVVDHRQALALLRQAQHGLGKVAAARGVHPAGPENQVSAASGLDALLAFELGLAIDAQRRGRVAFLPGPAAAAVKNIVGGVMHQPGAQLVSLLC